MATYEASSYFQYYYSDTGNSTYYLDSSNITNSVSDGETDSTFEPGDDVDLTNGPGGTKSLEYVGYYTGDSGTIYPVFLKDGGFYFAFSPQTLEDTTDDLSSLSISDLNTTDDFIVCFAAGTLIATPDGETKVEDLQIGDLILTAEGASVPVKWLGRRKVSKLFTPADRLRPVRVSAGALGNGLPHTDLILTADHALIIDDLAINASALVNGTTITFEPMDRLPDQFTYFHVETEDHNVILANGAPAETYIDYIARSAFDNHGEYLDLYGSEKVIDEMPLPRISAARMLPDAIRARLQGAKAA